MFLFYFCVLEKDGPPQMQVDFLAAALCKGKCRCLLLQHIVLHSGSVPCSHSTYSPKT